MQKATAGLLWACPVVLAAGVVLLLILRAAVGFDTTWDTISYHMPFAARLAGLCDRNCFEMLHHLEVRYNSLPVAIEVLQGLVWRLTGQPQAVAFVSLGFLFALVGYLRAAWAVPAHWSILAFLAVPMVQAAATSGYIDVATNCLATVCLLTVLAAFIRSSPIRPWETVVFVVCVVLLGNSKTQMMPVAGVLGLVFIAVASWRRSAAGAGAFSVRSGRGRIAAVLLLVAISATGIRNLVEFHNPVYPINVVVGGHTLLAGPEPMLSSNSVSTALGHLPEPVLWAMSVLEVSALDGRSPPYTVDQADVPQSLPSFRMGGYFGVYVLLCLGFLALAARRLPPPISTRITVAAASVTLVVALLPAAHELRYYMFWMLGLVALNVLLFLSPKVPDFKDRSSLARGFTIVILAAFVAVTSWTGGRYLMPTPSLAAVLATSGIQAQAGRIENGDIVCVPAIDRSFLYTTMFRADDRAYKVTQENDPSCNRRF